MTQVTNDGVSLMPMPIQEAFVSIHSDDKITIPEWIKGLGLSGNFPTPKKYFSIHGNDASLLKDCQLCDIVDVEYSEKTMELMLQCCNAYKVQMLIVNSPPASFAFLKEHMPASEAASAAKLYLDNMQGQWKALWEKVMQRCGVRIRVEIAVPSQEVLEKVLIEYETQKLMDLFVEGFPELEFEGSVMTKRNGFIVSDAGSPYVSQLTEAFHLKYWIYCPFSKLIFSPQTAIVHYV